MYRQLNQRVTGSAKSCGDGQAADRRGRAGSNGAEYRQGGATSKRAEQQQQVWAARNSAEQPRLGDAEQWRLDGAEQ